MRLQLFLLFICISCVYEPKKKLKDVRVLNKTNFNFYVYTSCDDKILNSPSIKYIHEGKSNIISGFEAKSNSENGSTYIYDYSLKSFFKSCDNKNLNVFLIKKSILETRSWKEICENQLFFKKMSLNENYFKDKDYIIIDSTSIGIN